MKYIFIIIISIVVFLYSAINYYIGARLLQVVTRLTPHLNIKVYWTFYWLFALSFILGRLLRSFLPHAISNILTLMGSYWLGIMFYSFLFIVFVDIIRLADKWFGFIPTNIKNSANIVQIIGCSIIVIIIALVTLGIWNAKNTKVVHYDVNISKQAGKLNSLHIVALSDIHLGVVVNEREIQKAVNIINGLNPDLVLFVGDTVDEDVNVFKEKNMVEIFGKIKSKYGNYAVLGNHEYIGGNIQEAIHYIEKAGIKVLRDNYVKINESFYLVGRDDVISNRMTGKPRKDLSKVLEGIDKNLPVILLDHQPSNLGEPQTNNVDLQLSGHTHKGQLYPIEFITDRVFDKHWGYLKKDNFNLIVSSGFGTWGPPMRVGNRSEILDITVNFKK